MITQKVGDLLTAKDVDVIVHQANLFCTFGAGIAAAIRVQFPVAYKADCATVNGDLAKLGTYSVAKIGAVKDTKLKYVVNLYSQKGLGSKDRQTSYDSMVDALTKLRDSLIQKGKTDYTVGVPFRIGCGLANGSWPIVKAILEDVFGKSPINVVIYQRPEDVE